MQLNALESFNPVFLKLFLIIFLFSVNYTENQFFQKITFDILVIQRPRVYGKFAYCSNPASFISSIIANTAFIKDIPKLVTR